MPFGELPLAVERFLRSSLMFITTTARASTKLEARARLIAARCGVSFVRRTAKLLSLLAERNCELAYVVRRDREELRTRDASLFVHPGMVALKRATGPEHPFIRAVQVHGAVRRVVDATIGMAGDALHVAAELGVPVVGIEASPVVYSMLEEGLLRLAKDDNEVGRAAALVTVHHQRAAVALSAMADGSTDVVLLDPMFDSPRAAAPGFELLRRVAYAEPSEDLLVEARRVASSHVVVKHPKRSTYPACDACINGKAVRYLVYDARR